MGIPFKVLCRNYDYELHISMNGMLEKMEMPKVSSLDKRSVNCKLIEVNLTKITKIHFDN